MVGQDSIDSNKILIYRSLWRSSSEDFEIFCARYGVSDDTRRILLRPPAPVTATPRAKTLMPVVLA